jgi:hypothetical protein
MRMYTGRTAHGVVKEFRTEAFLRPPMFLAYPNAEKLKLR